jgi:hypothetical protein
VSVVDKKAQSYGRDPWHDLSRERASIWSCELVGPASASSSFDGTIPGAPLWILAGTFKGILWYDERPTGALNTGDYYYDVGRGCMLVTDGAGNWFNPISPALPPI